MRNIRKRRFIPRVDAEVFQNGQFLLMEGQSATAVWTELNNRFGERAPRSARTVQLWAKALGSDPSGTWDIRAARDDEAAAVLSVLPALFEEIGPQAGYLSTDEATVIARLVRAVPGMPPIAMYRWARRYVASIAAELGAGDLLAYVAFQPWTADGAKRYVAAFEEHRVAAAMALSPGDEERIGASQKRSFTVNAVIAKAPVKPWAVWEGGSPRTDQ